MLKNMVESLTQAITIGKYVNYSTNNREKKGKQCSTNDDNVQCSLFETAMIMYSLEIVQIDIFK